MDFEQQLHTTITDLRAVRHRMDRDGDQAAALVAAHAPHLLMRFAALAGSLQTLAPTSGQGIILTCRNGPLGYRTAEYRSRNLHIVLDATEREACLCWQANGESGTYRLTPETTAHDLDAVILQAVAIFVHAQS